MKSEKLDLITNICMDMREQYQDKVSEFISASVDNGDITENEAIELKMQF